jgi:transposase
MAARDLADGEQGGRGGYAGLLHRRGAVPGRLADRTNLVEAGRRPVVRVTGKRPRVNAISAITWTGDLLFDLYSGSFNAELFCAFLARLDAFAGRDFIGVVDGLRVHHCKAVREFIEAKRIRVRLVQLPAYAPDLNPDEHVWSYLKGHRMKRAPLRDGESIDDLARGEMMDLAKDRDRVRSFFGHPAVRHLHHDAV